MQPSCNACFHQTINNMHVYDIKILIGSKVSEHINKFEECNNCFEVRMDPTMATANFHRGRFDDSGWPAMSFMTWLSRQNIDD